jgi:hypothetical protein
MVGIIQRYTRMQPSIPVAAIYPDAVIVRTLLIKPGYISHMIIYGFFSHIQAHEKL